MFLYFGKRLVNRGSLGGEEEKKGSEQLPARPGQMRGEEPRTCDTNGLGAEGRAVRLRGTSLLVLFDRQPSFLFPGGPTITQFRLSVGSVLTDFNVLISQYLSRDCHLYPTQGKAHGTIHAQGRHWLRVSLTLLQIPGRPTRSSPSQCPWRPAATPKLE